MYLPEQFSGMRMWQQVDGARDQPQADSPVGRGIKRKQPLKEREAPRV
jgi:hypothetical protein